MRPRRTTPRLHAVRHAARFMLTLAVRRRAPHGTSRQGIPAVATRDRATMATPAHGDYPHLSLALTMVHDVIPLDALTTSKLDAVIHVSIKGQREIEDASARLPADRSVQDLQPLGSRIHAVARAGAPRESTRRTSEIVRMIIDGLCLVVYFL